MDHTDPKTENELEIGAITIDPRAVDVFLKAITPSSPADRLRFGIREAFQNAIDATLAHSPTEPAEITFDIADGDLVIRDHGIGMQPKEINSLVLRLFGSGKSEGVGGFGAGTMSVIVAAPEVTILTRRRPKSSGEPVDSRGAEFKKSWIGTRTPRVFSEEEAEAFGFGTEIRFQNVLVENWEHEKVSIERAKEIITQMIATSEIPPNITVRFNGEVIEPLFRLGTGTLKVEADLKTTFPGCVIEHHIVPLPEDEEKRHPHLKSPRSIVQLQDPAGSSWSLTQWLDYIDHSVNFIHVVRIRPTVRPDEEHYPFNPERSTIRDPSVAMEIDMARQRFVTDRLSAVKQQKWRSTFYTGDDLSRDQMDDVSGALAEAAASEVSLRRIDRMLSLIQDIAESGVVNYLEQQRRKLEATRGDVVTVRELIADQPTLVRVHAEWQKPHWAPKSFDPDSPESIKTLAPLLVATRMLGTIVRAEAARVAGYPYSYIGKRPPFYGFVFSPDDNALYVEEDTPLGPDTGFVLINPAAEVFRTARTPEALCELILARLIHEHAHEKEISHNEAFTRTEAKIRDALVNIKPELHAAFKASGAWQAMRRFQGLPLKPSRVRSVLLKMPTSAEAADLVEEFGTDETLRNAIKTIVSYAREAEDRIAAATAFAEVLASLRMTKSLDSYALETLQKLAQRLGIHKVPNLVSSLADGHVVERPQEATAFQYDLLATLGQGWHAQDALSAIVGEYVSRWDLADHLARTRCSLAHMHSLYFVAQEIRFGTGDYWLLHQAYQQVVAGKTPREAIRSVKHRAVTQEEKALLSSRFTEAALAFAALHYKPELEYLRPALQEFLNTGALGRIRVPKTVRDERAIQAKLF